MEFPGEKYVEQKKITSATLFSFLLETEVACSWEGSSVGTQVCVALL